MPAGIDIANIKRFSKYEICKIPTKIYSQNEIKYILSKPKIAQSCAGIFAAKEAFLKSLGVGISEFDLPDIEILYYSSGKPYISTNGKVYEYCQKNGIFDFDVSISHDGDYAVACVCTNVEQYAVYYQKSVSKLNSNLDNAILPCHIAELLPKRKSETHKGNYGRLFAVAGSTGLTGAAIMACTSALKCGAGLITLGCAEHLNSIFEISLKEVMTKPFESCGNEISAKNAEQIASFAQNADSCLIGPGMGCSDNTTQVVKAVLKSGCPKIIVDADAINCIAKDADMLKSSQSDIAITPHIGEFQRLTGICKEQILKEPKKYALEFADKYNVTVILKSHQTVIAEPSGKLYTNYLGNPGMATGGTGDVLAGAAASFATQGMSIFDASKCAVYIHSLAADMAAQKTGEYSLTPSDILDFVPFAIKYSQGR